MLSITEFGECKRVLPSAVLPLAALSSASLQSRAVETEGEGLTRLDLQVALQSISGVPYELVD